METREILTRLQQGEISVDEAEQYFRGQPFEEDLGGEQGYAKLDTHRKLRQGFPEVIFCSGKADKFLVEIFGSLYAHEGEVLGTRASKAQYELIKEYYPEAEYDEVSRIIKIEKPDKVRTGCVAVCSAGTADIPVAEEAAKVAEYFGSHVERLYDVGVSGLHRMLSRLDVIQRANCVVAVAGMEGALAIPILLYTYL